MSQSNITRTKAMAHASRRAALRGALAAAVALALFAHSSAQPAPLRIARDGERLRLSAPQFHFLQDATLQQLHDGRSVTYVFTVILLVERGDARAARTVRHVVFSYDLWEERFSVSQADEPKMSASHLTAAAAEAWCLDLLSLPARVAPADKTFVVKLDCSLKEEPADAGDAPSATTFTGLIDLFSRKARAAPPRWEAVSLPMRLADLKDKVTG
jgi:hypothetical protein